MTNLGVVSFKTQEVLCKLASLSILFKYNSINKENLML